MKPIVFNPNLPPKTYIVDTIYEVVTVEEALRTKDSIERFGTPSTGFAKYDAQLVGSYTTCAISIARMSKIHARGFYLGLVKPEAAVNIYQSVQYYLESWMEVMRTRVNAIKVPYDLLHELERLAHLVYPHAAPRFITNHTGGDVLSLFIENFNRECTLEVLTELPEIENGLPVIPPRQSLQDELLDHQASWLR